MFLISLYVCLCICYINPSELIFVTGIKLVGEDVIKYRTVLLLLSLFNQD
jgi:hypothetical protein